MSRLLRITIWFLLLGAAANVAVTLILAAWDQGKLADPLIIAKWRRAIWESPIGKADSSIWVKGAYADWCGDIVWFKGSMVDGESQMHETIMHQIGWPFRSLAGEQIVRRHTSPQVMYRGAIALKGSLEVDFRQDISGSGTSMYFGGTVVRLLPLDPIWPGFLANTVLYGAGLWAAWAMLLLARVIVRRLRGRCGACGYPVGVSPVCTECGRPVRKRRNKPQLAASGDAKL